MLCLYFACEAAGALGARRSARPLFKEGGTFTGKARAHGVARSRNCGCLKFEFENAFSCPGRDAAPFALLRRTGTPVTIEKKLGPGSAAHRFAKSYALRCVRGTLGLSRLLAEVAVIHIPDHDRPPRQCAAKA